MYLTERMQHALLVFILDKKIRYWLKRHDPKALEQAINALPSRTRKDALVKIKELDCPIEHLPMPLFCQSKETPCETVRVAFSPTGADLDNFAWVRRQCGCTSESDFQRFLREGLAYEDLTNQPDPETGLYIFNNYGLH